MGKHKFHHLLNQKKNRAPSMSTETTSDTAIEPSSSPLSVAARVPSSSPLPATEEKKEIILAPSSSHHSDKKENQDDSDATKDTITAAAPSPVIKADTSFFYVPSPSSYPSLPSTPSSSSAAVQTTSIPTSFPSPSPETEEENKGSVSPSTILSPAPAPASSGTSNRPSGGLNSTTPGSSFANDNEEE